MTASVFDYFKTIESGLVRALKAKIGNSIIYIISSDKLFDYSKAGKRYQLDCRIPGHSFDSR